MNVTLTPDLEALINEKVQSGLYDSPSEVVRAALHLMNEQEKVKNAKLQNLRAEVMKGVKAMREGRYQTYNSGEEIAEEIIREGLEGLNQKKNGKQHY